MIAEIIYGVVNDVTLRVVGEETRKIARVQVYDLQVRLTYPHSKNYTN